MISTPPILKYIESFTVTGFSTKTQNRDEFDEQTAKLPSLWQQFYASELATNENLFEVYSNYESDANSLYTVTLGVNQDKPQKKFSEVNIQAGYYLVFESTGPMPSTVVATWKKIWRYFETEHQVQRSFISDFERYSGSDKVTIHIGVQL